MEAPMPFVKINSHQSSLFRVQMSQAQAVLCSMLARRLATVEKVWEMINHAIASRHNSLHFSRPLRRKSVRVSKKL